MKNKIFKIIILTLSITLYFFILTIFLQSFFIPGVFFTKTNLNKNFKYSKKKWFKNSDWSLEIEEQSFSNSSVFFLDDEGLKLLSEEIKKNLYHGQEIISLGRIVLGDLKNPITKGLYSMRERYIFININEWESESIFMSNEEKINEIMPTILHEYGHHIANVFFNKAKIGHNEFYWKGDPKKNFINDNEKNIFFTKNIFKNFYEIFEYNKDEKYTKNLNHIYAKTSPGEIFRKINSNNNYSGEEFETTETGEINTDIFVIRLKKKLPMYRFSIQELFTRQLKQLMQKYFQKNIFDLDLLVSNDVKTSGWKNVNKNHYDFYISEGFGDSVWKGNRSEKFYNLLIDNMGFSKTISNIYNTTKIYNTKLINGKRLFFDKNGTLIPEKNYIKNITITGFVPEFVTHIKIGSIFYPLKKNRNFWNFKKQSFIFENKTKIFDSYTNLVPYITDKLPLPNNNTEITFWKQKKHQYIPKKTNLINKNIPISTYQFLFFKDKNKKHSRIVTKNNKMFFVNDY